MSTTLQQVVKRSKVSTLDGELKDIAEQMLCDKFGFKEVVQPKPADVFQRGSQSDAGCSNSFCASCYGGIDPCGFRYARDDPRFYNPVAWGMRTGRISLDSCHELFRELQRNVGPSYRHRQSVWRMGRREFDDLARDIRARGAIEFGPNIKLFGIPVQLQGRDTFEIELSCYM